MVPPVRYSLQVKQVAPSGGGPTPTGGNSALLTRQGTVPMDDGRTWAGDQYEEGPITDPADGYATFLGGEDTEAWLDRNEDGTLTGWVREGDQVWRYSDAEAWALDVDGAQMQRTDAGPAAPVEGEDPAAADGEVVGGDGEGLDPDADPAADPEDAEAEAVADANGDDDEFVNPFALEEEDPDAEEDPDGDTSELTDDEGHPVEDQIGADPQHDDPEGEQPGEDPAEDTDPSDDEGDDTDPADDPAEDTDTDTDDAAAAEDEDEDDPEETEADRLFKKKGGQKKGLDTGILPGPERRPRGTVRPRRRR